MEIDLKPKIILSEIRDALSQKPMDDIWNSYLLWVKTLPPFWERATIEFADLAGDSEERKEKLLKSVFGSFEYMDDWRFQRIKHVKARRDEIDSAISYIRNSALKNVISDRLAAPVARNLASVLRGCLHIATNGYRDEQMPGVIAQDIYGIAACRIFLPYDKSDFVRFIPSDLSIHAIGGDLDNYHIMLESAAIA
jgi:hypothetical protein